MKDSIYQDHKMEQVWPHISHFWPPREPHRAVREIMRIEKVAQRNLFL